MPSPTSKSRQALKSRFVRGAIPTETDFSDLIGAGLNQAEDGLYKLPNEPLSLVRQKPDQPALRFYEDPAAAGSAWQINLADQGVAGFGIANAEGKTSLFIDKATGNLGIGTNEPKQALHVNGTAAITTLHADEVWIAGKKVGTDDGLAGKITVLPNGNVGIGTTTPEQRLSVEGSVGINGTLTRKVWAITGNKEDAQKKGRLLERTLKIYKSRDDTALRISYFDSWRISLNFTRVHGKWEVRVDGNLLNPEICSNIVFERGTSVYTNVEWTYAEPLSIQGYAKGIPAGFHEIQIWAFLYSDYGSILTGPAQNTWSIEVEEILLAAP